MKANRKIAEANQKNSIDDSAILRIFLDISPQRVKREIEDLESKAKQLRSLERNFGRRTWPTAGEMAESFHRRLLLGKRVTLKSQLHPDLILFSATVSAHRIAELSCSVATGKGRLSELAGVFEVLEKSGELDSKAPDVLLSNQLLEQIHDSVFLEILRRYDLNEYGRIFEDNRPLYEMRFGAGRSLIGDKLTSLRSRATRSAVPPATRR